MLQITHDFLLTSGTNLIRKPGTLRHNIPIWTETRSDVGIRRQL